ncbi:extracellular solute-binding protein [bacterium]|nr:extracellular solute-binding protein [bacterium]
MKHTLFILSTLLLLSCSKDDGILRLQLWHQMQPEDRAVLERVVKAYDNARDSLQITVIYKETEELRSAFQSAALAGLGPDLIYGPSDQVGPLATMQFIKGLDQLFDPERLAEFDPRCVVAYHDSIYMIADRIGNHLTLVYNTDLLPEPPQTTDDLIRMGKEATKDLNGDGVIDQWAIVWNFTEPFFFVPWLSGFGGWVFDDEGNPSLNTDAVVHAFEFVKALRDTFKIIPPDCDYNTADVMFKEGRAAMLINGPWSWSGYENAGIPMKLARIPMVSSTGLWPAPMIAPLGYSIRAAIPEKNLQASVALLNYLLSDSVQQQFVKATGVIPASLALREDPNYLSRPNMAESLSQLDVGRPMPVNPELRAVWDALRPAYQSVLGGNMSAKEAARWAQQLAEQKIREMNE